MVVSFSTKLILIYIPVHSVSGGLTTTNYQLTIHFQILPGHLLSHSLRLA